MSRRREFLRHIAYCGAAVAAANWWPAALHAQARLPARPIPDTQDELPTIGLGNSNAFRQGDLQLSARLIGLLHERGGRYVDCSGDSRFTVAEAARESGIGAELFLGSYFYGDDEAIMRGEIARLLEMTGKGKLDLAQSYPEFAIPNWALFQRWKAEGLTKYIGVARHRQEYYPDMMNLMETGTVDFIQVNYSPLETEAEQRILPMAMDRGVAVTINRPFINGEYFSRLRGQELPQWAAEFDCDNWAAFSLKFILAHPAVTCVLTETANPKHAVQNIEAGFGRLPDEKTRRRMVAYLQNL